LLRSKLLRSNDTDDEPRFVTVDRWKTAENFARFQEQFGAEYQKLDTQLEAITLRERRLGTFVSTEDH
jgi:heme-degrading monooxygenase HmoA